LRRPSLPPHAWQHYATMSAANILRFELRKPRSPEADNSMRKRVISPTAADAQREQLWLDLSNAASVEVTSEQPGYPIESALLPGHHGGWRAAVAGPQTIRLIFERPCTVRRILLVFEEPDLERTQLCCAGLPTKGVHFTKSYVSSGISAPVAPSARQKIIRPALPR
jgi:hypothetical protein